MAILLCSKNDTVRNKWSMALKANWQVHQVASVKELAIVVKRFPIETILLHRGSVTESELREICGSGGSKVFVLSDRPDDREGLVCLQLGCVGYANTYIAPQRLRAAIEAVESGLIWVGSSLMQHLIKGLAAAGAHAAEPDKPPASPQFAGLSNREYQIARMVADGMPNGEIAEQLDITERTVKAHLSSIYTKTQTKGRLSLALLMKKG
jgi:DNA-binding NarL/FixJ family response regulator